MEVAGLILTAVAFVDQAIKTGSVLSRLARTYPEAGQQIANAATRLEAQRFTLELWHKSWKQKALDRQPTALADKFRAMWGDDGYDLIVRCLTQINARFGEAFRTLKSIDPDSFHKSASGADSRPISLLSANPDPDTPASSAASVVGVGNDALKSSAEGKSKARRIFSEARKPGSFKFWKSSSKPVVAPTPPESPQQRLEPAEGAQEQLLGPGTKFKWSLGVKDDLRLLIAELDDWLEQLQTLSARCEEEQTVSKTTRAVATSKGIRAAAKDLYSVLLNGSPRDDLQLKLERERADSGYFDQLLGPVAYVDETNSSFKFPLLISGGIVGNDPFLLIAEALLPTSAFSQFSEADKVKTIDEVIFKLQERAASIATSTTSTAMTMPLDPMLLQTSQIVIVLHELPDVISKMYNANQPVPRCSFSDLLQAEASVNPFVAAWKRVQLACIIAVSVLHLYETGWLSEQLEMSDFHFFGTADSQYLDSSFISPYVSPTGPKTVSRTPFDCLRPEGSPQTFLGARDERLATLFYRLGIVLFELGRGIEYVSISDGLSLGLDTALNIGNIAPEDINAIRRSRILREIEKIPFSRSYADLVKYCLTGRLYATSKLNVDGIFNEAVIGKLRKLEMDFSAILEGTD